MTLWHLMTAWCFCIPVASAVALARRTGLGLGAQVVWVLGGVIVGAAGVWAMQVAMRMVAARSARYSEAKTDGAFRALYISVMVWIFVVFPILAGLIGRAFRAGR